MDKRTLNADIYESTAVLKALAKKFFLKQDYHPLIFKSKGLEFEGYRKYSSTDDASNIDWKASQRANQLMVRKFKQERELKVAFFIDSGDNMVFGSQEKLKCEYAAEISAAMATLIIESNNLIGFSFFSDDIDFFKNFLAGRNQLNLFYNSLLDASNYGGGSNLNSVLDYAMSYFGKDISLLFIVSDFLTLDKEAIKKFQLLSHKFDIIAFKIIDPIDKELPDVSESVFVQDPNSQRQLLINPRVAKGYYDYYSQKKHYYINKNLKEAGVTLVELNTDKSFVEPISLFLKKRMYEVM